jgi:lipid-A-disaccharide synthase-like uncharacterized protein
MKYDGIEANVAKPRSTFNLILLLLATSLPLTWVAWRWFAPESTDASARFVPVRFQIDGNRQHIDLLQNDDGTHSFIIDRGEPSQRILSPDELAQRIFQHERSRSWIEQLFNISGPIGFIWVGIGLLGQLLFTGRMVVQWLATEKTRRSVVPPAFWWMSLIGAMMLLTYFIWRRDIVGVLGQSFGLLVYVRNLYFIHIAPQEITAADDPAPEPQWRGG